MFTLNETTNSDTHDQYRCKKCSRDGSYSLVGRGEDTVKGIVGDLAQWDHFPQTKYLKVRREVGVGMGGGGGAWCGPGRGQWHRQDSGCCLDLMVTTTLMQDLVLREAAGSIVSFVFRAQSHARVVKSA